MKTFIIINGKSVRTIKTESMEQAVTIAENTCDHSKEIIVREIETLQEIQIDKEHLTEISLTIDSALEMMQEELGDQEAKEKIYYLETKK